MATTVTASSGIADVSHGSPPPDWALVPFDVGCARCGHDLRGQSEPKCPACSLEFDWGEAVTIEKLTCSGCGYRLYGLTEPRCPECGWGFDWNEVLDVWRRRRKNLLEYRWRDGIIRSTFSTWRRLLRPGRFWRSIDLHDPPETKPLVVFMLATILAATLAWNTFATAGQWIWFRSMRGNFAEPPLTEIPGMWLSNLTSPSLWGFCLVVASWCGATLPALLVLRQSMRLCSVRNWHVIRVWVYATTGLLLPCLAAFVLVFIPLSLLDTSLFSTWFLPILGAYVLYATWSIRQGYRHYLQMTHSTGVAIATQLMALLATLCILIGVSRLM